MAINDKITWKGGLFNSTDGILALPPDITDLGHVTVADMFKNKVRIIGANDNNPGWNYIFKYNGFVFLSVLVEIDKDTTTGHMFYLPDNGYIAEKQSTNSFPSTATSFRLYYSQNSLYSTYTIYSKFPTCLISAYWNIDGIYNYNVYS